ncbi:MAG: hypothetical protein HY696_01490 [Deltaproteobacteria bacterium]|nr:hypothetical protein [Deltaproteobacteria bacterium]
MPEPRETTRGPLRSAGYPAVEDLIDSEAFDPVNQAFESAYQQLEGVARQKGGLKKSREARKAMRSIELVMDLLRELLTIKYQLADMAKAQKGA